MPTKQEIKERWNFFADRISTQVRTIAIGLLATTWALLIGKLEVTKEMVAKLQTHLFLIGAFAIVTLFFDFLQYFFGYLNINNVMGQMDRDKLEEADYRYDYLYILNSLFFWAKQITLIACALWFVACLVAYYFFMSG